MQFGRLGTLSDRMNHNPLALMPFWRMISCLFGPGHVRRRYYFNTIGINVATIQAVSNYSGMARWKLHMRVAEGKGDHSRVASYCCKEYQ